MTHIRKRKNKGVPTSMSHRRIVVDVASTYRKNNVVSTSMTHRRKFENDVDMTLFRLQVFSGMDPSNQVRISCSWTATETIETLQATRLAFMLWRERKSKASRRSLIFAFLFGCNKTRFCGIIIYCCSHCLWVFCVWSLLLSVFSYQTLGVYSNIS